MGKKQRNGTIHKVANNLQMDNQFLELKHRILCNKMELEFAKSCLSDSIGATFK